MESTNKYKNSWCPHLGIYDDPDTRFSFATTSNFCYFNLPPESIEIAHQDKFCLTSNFIQCPKLQPELISEIDDLVPSPKKEDAHTFIETAKPQDGELKEKFDQDFFQRIEDQSEPFIDQKAETPLEEPGERVEESVFSSTPTLFPFSRSDETLDHLKSDDSIRTEQDSSIIESESVIDERTGEPHLVAHDSIIDQTDKDQDGRSSQKLLSLVTAAIFIVILIFIFFKQFDLLPSNLVGVSLATITTTNTSTHTPEINKSTQIKTPEPSFTPTDTLEPTLTSTLVPTKSPTLFVMTVTPGPLLETPFGTSTRYLIHKIKLGESLPLLAARYDTTQDVILYLNEFLLVYGFQPDQTLIIMPGQKDTADLVVMDSTFIETPVKISEFTAQHAISVQELQDYNDLDLDEELLSNRWIIFPDREIILSPTVTPIIAPDLSQALTSPFGPEQNYILHRVKPGESMPVIEDLYLTSAEVIRKANRIDESVRVDQVLVIVINQTDPDDIPLFGIIQVENAINVTDLALYLGQEAEDLIYYNGLDNDDVIESGRWIIYPID